MRSFDLINELSNLSSGPSTCSGPELGLSLAKLRYAAHLRPTELHLCVLTAPGDSQGGPEMSTSRHPATLHHRYDCKASGPSLNSHLVWAHLKLFPPPVHLPVHQVASVPCWTIAHLSLDGLRVSQLQQSPSSGKQSINQRRAARSFLVQAPRDGNPFCLRRPTLRWLFVMAGKGKKQCPLVTCNNKLIFA